MHSSAIRRIRPKVNEYFLVYSYIMVSIISNTAHTAWVIAIVHIGDLSIQDIFVKSLVLLGFLGSGWCFTDDFLLLELFELFVVLYSVLPIFAFILLFLLLCEFVPECGRVGRHLWWSQLWLSLHDLHLRVPKEQHEHIEWRSRTALLFPLCDFLLFLMLLLFVSIL